MDEMDLMDPMDGLGLPDLMELEDLIDATEPIAALDLLVRSGLEIGAVKLGGVMAGREPLIPPHGGYRKLKSFQVAQLAYDVTVRFCDRYVDRRSRTHDQMVQAARSGVQNIAEGSQASGTSKKMELKLTNVARASLEELRLDYEDFLRQRNLRLWPEDDPRRKALVARRCATADEVAEWARGVHDAPVPRDPASGTSMASISSIPSPGYPEIAANGALVLVGVACALLDRQLAALGRDFEQEGGFTERLHRVRRRRRGP
jgi:four helix bundle suffix protein